MPEEIPIKSTSKEYSATPFWYLQKGKTTQRFVAWFSDKEKIRRFLLAFSAKAPAALEIKILDLDDAEQPRLFTGNVSTAKLEAALDQFEETVFHDGYHDLLIRIPETDEFVVFDQHGVVFIYSKENYAPELESFGLIHKPGEALIDAFSHWHYRPANGKEQLEKLIGELGLR